MLKYCFAWVISLLLLTSSASALSFQPALQVTVHTQTRDHYFNLQVAANPAARERGLMGYKKLAPYDGMIFLFPDNSPRKFWMQDTLVPLDMLFIDEAGTIIAIEANAPPHSLEFRGPNQPVVAVIELDGGRAAREGIAVGDKVRYALPKGFRIE